MEKALDKILITSENNIKALKATILDFKVLVYMMQIQSYLHLITEKMISRNYSSKNEVDITITIIS